jgi:hypothetical protein
VKKFGRVYIHIWLERVRMVREGEMVRKGEDG